MRSIQCLDEHSQRRTIEQGNKMYKTGDKIDCIAFIMAGLATSETDAFTVGYRFGEDELLSSFEAGHIIEGVIEKDRKNLRKKHLHVRITIRLEADV